MRLTVMKGGFVEGVEHTGVQAICTDRPGRGLTILYHDKERTPLHIDGVDWHQALIEKDPTVSGPTGRVKPTKA